MVPLALTVLVFSVGAAVVVNVAPNWNVVFGAGADVVVAVQLPNRDWEGVCVVGAADDVDTVAGWVLVNPPNNIPLFCEAGAAGVDVVGGLGEFDLCCGSRRGARCTKNGLKPR